MIAGHRGQFFTRQELPGGLEAVVAWAWEETRRDGWARRVYMKDEEGDPGVWVERADRVGPVGGVVFMTVERWSGNDDSAER